MIAVSKTKPNSDVMEAYNAGQRIFGENKVQELAAKYEALPKDIEWHMIGHLQTNKVKELLQWADGVADSQDKETPDSEIEEDLLQAIRSRTEINLATGILMAQGGCSQSEAFELLAKVSNTRNVKLRIVAEEILQRFDGAPAGTAFST